MSEFIEDEKVKEHIETIKREIYDKLGKRSKEKLFELIDNTFHILSEEKEEGDGKLKDKIEDIIESENGGEYFVDKSVAYLPREGEACFIGDLHGDLESLKEVLKDSQFFENMEAGDKSLKLVFLGDYKDRGSEDEEVLELLMDLKNRYPDNITMLRGNHEYEDAAVRQGERSLGISLFQKYGLDDAIETMKKYNTLFRLLSSTLVTGNIIATHGGIPSEEVKSLKDLNDGRTRWEMAWNDPGEDLTGDEIVDNKARDSSIVKSFGYRAFMKFIKTVGARVMVRGHE
ncbi:MAG: serine/threonine protein phosphatase, partial [Parcubacteria group bacterium]|nr:serine/threonine protein phosphatase [Parcubacteria group bacterium]